MSSEELVRVSDAEREHAVVRLRDASAAGRLTLEELSDRTGLAYTAATKAELELVTVDLPAVAGPQPVERRRNTRLLVGVFGPLSRRGRWQLAGRTIALSIFAPCSLDLRSATFPQDEATLWVFSVFAPVSITVPEQVDVDLGAFTVFAPTFERGTPAALPPEAPRLRIRGASVFGPLFVTHRRS
jgi:hypothetical protein